jgi:type II secretory ATPase GspE/PulE/Tfp pilus assembly ATPase PilB-like protein
VITVEDPVEYRQEGIYQVQVAPSIGLTFAVALRSILRQAPNRILIGEIRDRETMEIALEASLTGHLVLSTLHCGDCASAWPRLQELGAPAYQLSAALRTVVAQRLLRRLIPGAGYRAPAADWEVAAIGRALEKCSHETFSRGRDPRRDYKGRIGIFEMFEMDENIASELCRGSGGNELRTILERSGFCCIRCDALEKARQGLTSLEEVLAATAFLI